MKITKLSIPAYRNLLDFCVEFDAPTTVLLGRNGSGKSNLAEAIVEIFRDLDLGAPPSFKYFLEYTCRGRTITIDGDPGRSGRRLDIRVDHHAITQTAFQRNLAEYLPSYVFAYYSGWSPRLERHFDEPTRKHYHKVLNSPDREMPLRRLFFCRKEYSQLVLLAFFLADSPSALNVLEQYLGIRRFESALFVLKTPWWGNNPPSKIQLIEGDPRFWYARGAFKGFLGRLWQRSLAPIRNNETVERDIRRQAEKTQRMYLFIKDEVELAGLREGHEDSKLLFGYLESLFLCDLIDEVRVTVERVDGARIKFTQMSEGEQQLVTVLGLLLFTQNDESLYLLDEPDTHLNPVWTYDFLELLQGHIRAERGQLIVATHNPLMIGSLRKEQVRLLARRDRLTVGGTQPSDVDADSAAQAVSGPADGRERPLKRNPSTLEAPADPSLLPISASEPEYDPIGVGIEGLLKSELYGLRSTLAPDVLKKLDEHYRLLGISVKSDADVRRLMELNEELNALGVSRSHPNPYFEQFANALARRQRPHAAPASKDELNEQVQLADEVLAEILAAEGAGGGDS